MLYVYKSFSSGILMVSVIPLVRVTLFVAITISLL